MKYPVKDFKELMKENGIKGGSMMIKQELIDVLREKQLLPEPLPENQLNHSRSVQNKKFQDL